MNKPLLIVVTGRPGSGKTTLAHTLAHEVRCPLLSRDKFKEGLVHTSGDDTLVHERANGQVYQAFFETLALLLRYGITIVAEAAFQHKLWAPALDPLREGARIRIVVCSIDPEVARSRFVQRGLADPLRRRFHDERAVQAARAGMELPIADYDLPHLAVPTLTVDTSDGYCPTIPTILEFANAGVCHPTTIKEA